MEKVNGINVDLVNERKRASFDPLIITHILDGGGENTERRRKIEKTVFSEAVIRADRTHDLSYAETYGAALARIMKIFDLALKHGWGMDELKLIGRLVRYDLAISLHAVMFVPAIERLSTDEQREKWLPLAMSMQIIGSYAQTEMGHGTNLRNLETTAAYDANTETFILNTPFPSGMKWWPGALGKSSTHTIVLATLMINGKNHGMHPFLVQLRSLETHMPLPGIQVGDIGPKFGLNSADNGYLILDNVRVPRDQMLMRYAQVAKDGTFTTRGAAKANYGTMILVRANLITYSYYGLSQAVTIATRYSAVRRQTSLKAGAPESQILDFQLQQQKIFPQLAAAYALFFVQKAFDETYNKTYEQFQENDFSSLPELHCQASCLKARTTEICIDGIDVCRRACGGHGYLKSSGMVDLYGNHMSSVTVEGENTVLYLQTARFLVKCFSGSGGSKVGASSVAYLSAEPGMCPIRTVQQCTNHFSLAQAYHQRAYRLVKAAVDELKTCQQRGLDQHSAWNATSVQLVNAAKAHSEACILSEFAKCLRGLTSIDVRVKPVLTLLCSLYAINGILQDSGEFLSTEAITVEQLNLLRDEHCRLLAAIRPEAVTLVDAFDHCDEALQSALGAYDGNAYERLYEYAKNCRANEAEVHPSFQKYVKPYFKSLL